MFQLWSLSCAVAAFFLRVWHYLKSHFRTRNAFLRSSHVSQEYQLSRISGYEPNENVGLSLRSEGANLSFSPVGENYEPLPSPSQRNVRMLWKRALETASRAKRPMNPVREVTALDEITSLRSRFKTLGRTHNHPNSDHIRHLQFSSDGRFLATSR